VATIAGRTVMLGRPIQFPGWGAGQGHGKVVK
jgi:hypothetical protein